MAVLNGRVPVSLLTKVGVNKVGKVMYLTKEAARTYLLLVRFVRLFLGQLLGLADAYRDLAGQRKTYADMLAGGPSAAWPGTSNHGTGIAADFAAPMNSSASEMHRFARWFFPMLGWYWEGDAYGEPWHWVFRGIPARITLKRGSKGNLVKLWQAWLYFRWPNVGPLDGDFGQKTEYYTKAWQRASKLRADGVVGPKTWKKAGLA